MVSEFILLTKLVYFNRLSVGLLDCLFSNCLQLFFLKGNCRRLETRSRALNDMLAPGAV
ncbi:hypothetical protein PsAD37_02808 [Pseudovibrio sp. Ad37]|nr:hypothetical protein PsAD37_02808 [Pseudovibrio sp. Ad37]